MDNPTHEEMLEEAERRERNNENLKRTERAQKVMNAGHRVVDGGVPLGKLIREGKKDPMSARVNYEYAAVLREAVQWVLPDYLEKEEHNPSGKFVAWKYELLKIADELEAL